MTRVQTSSYTNTSPFGGGLGGGSADAAAVLVALNRLWNLNLSLTDLADLGGRLGADIPVLVLDQTSWGEGSGKDLPPSSSPLPFISSSTPPSLC